MVTIVTIFEHVNIGLTYFSHASNTKKLSILSIERSHLKLLKLPSHSDYESLINLRPFQPLADPLSLTNQLLSLETYFRYHFVFEEDSPWP